MKEIKEVFSYWSGDYEWAQFVVYKHPRERRKFAVDIQSGCSCEGYQIPTLAELEAETPLTMTEARAKFSEWWDGNGRYYVSDTKVAALESFRNAF